MTDDQVLDILRNGRVASSRTPDSGGIGIRLTPSALSLECEVEEQVLHPPISKDEWRAKKKQWLAGGWCKKCQALPEHWHNACRDCDYSIWGQDQPFVKSGHYHYAFHRSRQGWPEVSVAMPLLAQGFTCWTGIHLFERGRSMGPLAKSYAAAIDGLFKERNWLAPRAVQDSVIALSGGKACKPRNPDLVAYHAGRREWRFVEAKDDDDVKEGQILGLAILHFITGAHVEVIRVDDNTRTSKRKRHQLRRRHTSDYTFEISLRTHRG